MVDTLRPVNAVAGAPSYSGRMLRQAGSVAYAGATAARPLGARTGVRPGTPTTTVTATSTTWSCGMFAGTADVEAAAQAGPYDFAFDAATSGAITAADATFPRSDLIYVQVDDPSESDGSTVPAVTRKYIAGPATSNNPSDPALPVTRGFAIARVNMPKAGGGAPTVTWIAPYMAAAGGIIPTSGLPGSYPTGAHIGEYVDDAQLGYPLRFDGTTWKYPFGPQVDGTITGAIGYTITAATDLWKEGRSVNGTADILKNVGSFTTGSVIATLAAGFRPAKPTNVGCSFANGTTGMAAIDTSGNVTIYFTGTASNEVYVPAGFRTP